MSILYIRIPYEILTVFVLPFEFARDRYFTPRHQRLPFVRRASCFEDFVIRCVRYAFAEIPASVGRVFLSKAVALPFFRFRMLRHGYLWSPIYWREVNHAGVKGLWIVADPAKAPDLIVYYLHGGGFSMGSSYFYMEFLVAMVHLLQRSTEHGQFRNPALFALEYSLVPDATFPCQLEQAAAGYRHLLSILPHPARIVPVGDSAGGTLILAMLLYFRCELDDFEERIRPAWAVLISPWVTLVSPEHRDTPSDFISVDSLHRYGRQYAGSASFHDEGIVSPGVSTQCGWWYCSMPRSGIAIIFGSEETLARDTKNLIDRLRWWEVHVSVRQEEGFIHAWPVAKMFLSDTGEARLAGLREIVASIGDRVK